MLHCSFSLPYNRLDYVYVVTRKVIHEDTQPSSNKILNVYLRAVTFFLFDRRKKRIKDL